jgi:hypothetical protein
VEIPSGKVERAVGKKKDCDDLCKKLLGLVLGEVVKTSLPGLDLLLFEN